MPELVDVSGHHFFPGLVDSRSRVLDLGAHRGAFSLEVRRLTGASVVAVEANPRLFAELPKADGVEKLNFAVADKEGDAELFVGLDPYGTSIFGTHSEVGDETILVSGITLERLVEEHCDGRVDLLKVDIEGAEIPMLAACSDDLLRRIRQITIEFHDFIPSLDQGEEVATAKERLKRLGFDEIVFKAPNKDVLFVNLAGGAMSKGGFRLARLGVRLRQYKRAIGKRLQASE